MKRCAVLLIGRRHGNQQAVGLKELGFAVTTADELPGDAQLMRFPIVAIAPPNIRSVPMIAAHLRCKPAFGRRVILAVVPEDADQKELSDLKLCGVDEVFRESAPPRLVASGILRRLKARPELDCEPPSIPDEPAA